MYESCLYTSQAPERCHYEEFHVAVLVSGLIIHNSQGISNMRTCVSEPYVLVLKLTTRNCLIFARVLAPIEHAYLFYLSTRTCVYL